ncbi:MAG: mandelate racemase/muconate lactonizing enzyme family protein [Desulfobacteria bacterium]
MEKDNNQLSGFSSEFKEQVVWDFRISRIETFLFRALIRTPVKTAFGEMKDRPALLLRVEDEDGAFGWGEVWCNFPAFGAEHRARLIESVLAPYILQRSFKGQVFDELTKITHPLALQTGEIGPFSQAISGLDIALWDLAARRAGVPLYALLGGRKNKAIPLYASGINPDGALDTVERCRKDEFSAFKLKVGFDSDRDFKNIKAIVSGLWPGEVFMIDANQAWDLETAQSMISKISNFPIAWLEEPLAADRPSEEWAELARFSLLPLSAGENICDRETFQEIITSGSIAVIQPDVCKWGGLTGCRWVASKALNAGRRYCPHFLGGGIGLIVSAHLLAATGGDGLLEVDINPNPLREGLAQPFPKVSKGMLTLSDGPGLGVEPNMDIVRKFLVEHKDFY